MAHPKVIERANSILSKGDEEVIKEINEITNITVLNVLLEQERTNLKRETILLILKQKLGISGDEVSTEVTESLAQEYLNGIVESEQETFVFDTSLIKKKEEEEKQVDSPSDSTQHSDTK